jgi:hypothetical protein
VKGIAAAFAVLLAASPASAEHIVAYWKLDATTALGRHTMPADKPALVQKMVPIGLVELKQAAVPAGSDKPVSAGTLLYAVVNAAGQLGYCTIKDSSTGHLARTLFIPIADQRPCFVDRDGDGRFDASFSVFDADTKLSPPQPRGSIAGAKPMATPAAYARAAGAFPVAMTYTYELHARTPLSKSYVRVSVDRPGHHEWQNVSGTTLGDGVMFKVLGVVIVARPAPAGSADVEVAVAPEGYVFAHNNDGTEFTPSLPAIAALKD